MQQGPRIYNLFPLLAGAVADWHHHLPRIAAMGFDWIYLNPFHYPGFSGSLYAVKEYDRLHPLFQGGSSESADELLRRFAAAAGEHGLRVMMDLVVNHTAKDSPLVETRSAWFARNPDGSPKSPRAVDPVDPGKFTEWGDLAEIDYHNRALWPELITQWSEVARHFAGLGFAGFRCDAAYKVPAEVWAGIIANVHDARPDGQFAAETLGCRVDEIEALATAGFHYLFNSAKWWDFKSDWLLDQYDTLRRIAPSIAFPESHDTPRLMSEVPRGGDPLRYYRLRTLLAAFVSSGWMIPLGFEFGFRKALNVVETRPDDWEAQAFDLSPFITAVNACKRATPAMTLEGPQERLTRPDNPLVALLRRTPDGTAAALLLMNSDGHRAFDVEMAALLRPTGFAIDRFEDCTPDDGAASLPERVRLEPFDVRLLRTRASGAGRVETPPAYAVDAPTSSAGGAHIAETAVDLMAGLATRAILIEGVTPKVDGGRFAVKREVGDLIEIGADIFKDGHDRIAAAVLYREKGEARWREAPMALVDGNDRWVGRFKLERNTRYEYTVESWVDHFESWRHDVGKKRDAGQSIALELTEGRALVAASVERAELSDRDRLRRILADFDAADGDDEKADLLQSTMLRQIMARNPDRSASVRSGAVSEVIVDRIIARFAAWYEMMARSQGSDPTASATFHDCIRRLPEIRAMGFDVLYLLPIHPIGRVHRKGPNNTLSAGPHDPGSPYAIGSDEGGHKAVHPGLGTLDDFRALVRAAADHGMEVALDFAIQCAPDHPYVREHPEWFVWRPDGTIKYAENPPKKYQDIVNVNFYGPHARALWDEMLSVVLFWCEQGVTIFRVDNPHTKPVPFWEWLIRTVQENYPGTIFLSEAFTRPKMMRMLAKVGFTQSYTYFTWRNFKAELTDYLTELSQSESREYFRPNFFPTTPDILPQFLQTGGRPAFRIRFVLAATLSSVYGIYNSYELCESAGIPGKEEYMNSEKYQYKVWDWDRPGNIKDEITAINRIRRENPALHEFENVRFHQADDDNVIFYSKMTLDRSNIIFVAVNLDPFDAHDAVLHFPLEMIGVPAGETFEVEELLTGVRHLWRGIRHKVRLDPQVNPAAIFRVTVWTSVDYRTPCF